MRQMNRKYSHTREKSRCNVMASVVTRCPGNYPISTLECYFMNRMYVFFIEIG